MDLQRIRCRLRIQTALRKTLVIILNVRVRVVSKSQKFRMKVSPGDYSSKFVPFDRISRYADEMDRKTAKENMPQTMFQPRQQKM